MTVKGKLMIRDDQGNLFVDSSRKWSHRVKRITLKDSKTTSLVVKARLTKKGGLFCYAIDNGVTFSIPLPESKLVSTSVTGKNAFGKKEFVAWSGTFTIL